ncbi:hypothetical protein GCM10022289_44950 [Pedobacter jeongneungensis]|uniref:Uncharacterized protein n=1 Tax=Pedobacter jeongneungensis TaxID=947309 RepID=A0ABP8BQY2_9SPHI
MSTFWEKDDFVAVEDCGGAGVVKGSVRAGDLLARDKGLLCGVNGCGWMIYSGGCYHPFSGQSIFSGEELGDLPGGLFPFERPFVLKPKNPE